MSVNFRERLPRKEVSGGKISMRDRVDNADRAINLAELKIEQQQTMIDDLKTQNADLVRAISVFKTQLEEAVAIAVESVQKDMRVKHGVLKAKNKQLADLVVDQKAEKQMLITQVETLDARLASLEDAVGI